MPFYLSGVVIVFLCQFFCCSAPGTSRPFTATSSRPKDPYPGTTGSTAGIRPEGTGHYPCENPRSPCNWGAGNSAATTIPMFRRHRLFPTAARSRSGSGNHAGRAAATSPPHTPGALHLPPFDEKPNSSRDKVETNASITRTGLSAAMVCSTQKSAFDGGWFLRSVACEPVVVAFSIRLLPGRGSWGKFSQSDRFPMTIRLCKEADRHIDC